MAVRVQVPFRAQSEKGRRLPSFFIRFPFIACLGTPYLVLFRKAFRRGVLRIRVTIRIIISNFADELRKRRFYTMSTTITAKKGLSLKLKGEAENAFFHSESKGDIFALVPEDFTGVIPRLTVKVGDAVKAGDPLFYHKKFPEVKFVTPVSGEVVAIERGAKRKILSIQVRRTLSDTQEGTKRFAPLAVDTASSQEIKNFLLESGLWAFIRQRPYDIIAEPIYAPRDIFVTAHFTAPLAPDFSFILGQGENKKYFETALKALRKLTAGKVFLSVKQPLIAPLEGVEECIAKGPHPAGTVGFLINATRPINKGDVVWTLKATDLLVMGRLMTTGEADYSRIVAVTGSEATKHGYTTVIPGCQLANTISETIPSSPQRHLRLINGDVYTGKKIDTARPFASWDVDQTTLIPEGDETHELLGWIAPRLKQFSISKTYFSWLFPNKKYALDARIKGGERHMIMSGEFERVFPLSIMPEALLKATMAFNIDKMEDLGIYEVAPEDFALCEFVDSSKQPLQEIIRQGLDLLYKEMN